MSRFASRLKRFQAELGFAALLFLLGAAIVGGALEQDVGWRDDGPGAGYFPLRIGVIICLASLGIMGQALMTRHELQEAMFRPDAVANLLGIVAPTVLCAAAIPFFGLYLSAAVYVGFFIRWRARQPLWKAGLISLAVPTVFFAVFELWLRIALPKGSLMPSLPF